MSDAETGAAPAAEPLDPVVVRLTELGVDSSVIEKIKADLGAASIDDLAGLTEADLVGAGMKVLQARRLVSTLQREAVETTAPAAAASSALSIDSLLPAVPDDSSWLKALIAGGVLKVDQSSVISAIRAALAHRARLFEVPDLLVKEMEAFADKSDDQVDPEFFRLRKLLTRRNYGDIFEAIDGLDGTYVTESRKRQLFSRVDEKLWPAIIGFNNDLRAWQESWMTGAANPAMMMAAMMAATTGRPGMGMPPGMMEPPDTGTIRDSAAAVADAINRVFAGTGVQIAAALAVEASRIKDTLSNPRLPALIGAANREQMLRQIGVAISPIYARLELNLTRFVLGTMQVPDQPAGEDIQYYGALYMLGTQIPWEQLGFAASGGKVTGIGGARRAVGDRL